MWRRAFRIWERQRDIRNSMLTLRSARYCLLVPKPAAAKFALRAMRRPTTKS